MHWESFYIDPEEIIDDSISFTGDEVRHLGRSLRKRPGDKVWAVDGQGTAYEVELIKFSRDEIIGRILSRRRRLGEPVAEITLAQGLLKGDRFDWVVEKAVELGVHRIIPAIGGKTDVKAGSGKVTRWRRIAMAAMKQSGRTQLTEITDPMTVSNVLKTGADCSFRLMAHPGKGSGQISKILNKVPSRAVRVLALVGSEGGFTEKEVESAEENGFQTVTLGPRRLRSETAGLVIMSLIMSELGELI